MNSILLFIGKLLSCPKAMIHPINTPILHVHPDYCLLPPCTHIQPFPMQLVICLYSFKQINDSYSVRGGGDGEMEPLFDDVWMGVIHLGHG